MNKNGVSGVVTAILVILISIAAIAVVFVVVMSFGKQGIKQTDAGTKSVSIIGQIEAEVLEYNPCKNVSIRIKRTIGFENITGMLIVLTDDSGKSFSYNESIALNELEVRVLPIDFSSSGLCNLNTIDLVPFFISSSGQQVVSSSKQTISRSGITGGSSGFNNNGDNGVGVMGSTRVLIEPSISAASVGSSTILRLKIKDVSDLYGFQYNVRYNPAVLQYVGAIEGSFLKQAGVATFFIAPNSATPGLLKGISVSRMAVSSGVSGEGELAEVQFKVIALGTSSIGIEKGEGGIYNSTRQGGNYYEIPADLIGATVSAS